MYADANNGTPKESLLDPSASAEDEFGTSLLGLSGPAKVGPDTKRQNPDGEAESFRKN
jgi:hypothetical protein